MDNLRPENGLSSEQTLAILAAAEQQYAAYVELVDLGVAVDCNQEQVISSSVCDDTKRDANYPLTVVIA